MVGSAVNARTTTSRAVYAATGVTSPSLARTWMESLSTSSEFVKKMKSKLNSRIMAQLKAILGHMDDLACNNSWIIKPKRHKRLIVSKVIRMVRVRLNAPSRISALRIRIRSLMRALPRSSTRERISSSSWWWRQRATNRSFRMSNCLRMASSVRV